MKPFGFRILIVVLVVFFFCCGRAADDTEIARAQEFLERYSAEAEKVYYQSSLKAWTYNTNVTDYNSEQMVKYFHYLSVLSLY